MEADLARLACAIDMVDGALETLDLTLSKRGIVGFTFGFFVDDSDTFSKFSFFEFFENFSTHHRPYQYHMSNGLDLLPKWPHGSKMSKIEKADF